MAEGRSAYDDLPSLAPDNQQCVLWEHLDPTAFMDAKWVRSGLGINTT